ncbi:MAG: hypothetical protein RQ862_01540 [Candidatus Caldarchaeales archaeon]|nr:hypothetical protein [Candidatus Caldarchaeales archaeon]
MANVIKGRTDFVVISQTKKFYRMQDAVIDGLINVLSETIKWLEGVRGKASISGVILSWINDLQEWEVMITFRELSPEEPVTNAKS